MPRLPRFDRPGRWFHVMNRGLAHRPAFESKEDVRYFLSRIALAVQRGELEVHAFCIMTTHFHLLVRSPAGKLSEAMRRIQNEYVRYFNRCHDRDGPLFRGRFLSRPVLSRIYRRILVGYIDANPVKAGLVRQPWEYPYGSAALFVSGDVPPWLCRRWILGRVERVAQVSGEADYVSVWGRPLTRSQRELVELRIRGSGLEEDDLDDLVGAAPAHVQEWMQRRAHVADHTHTGLACVPARVVLHVVEGLKASEPSWQHPNRAGRNVDAWKIATAGLLRHLSGRSHEQTAQLVGVSRSMIARRLRTHRSLSECPDYASRVGQVAHRCIQTAFPDESRRVRKWS